MAKDQEVGLWVLYDVGACCYYIFEVGDLFDPLVELLVGALWV